MTAGGKCCGIPKAQTVYLQTLRVGGVVSHAREWASWESWPTPPTGKDGVMGPHMHLSYATWHPCDCRSPQLAKPSNLATMIEPASKQAPDAGTLRNTRLTYDGATSQAGMIGSDAEILNLVMTRARVQVEGSEGVAIPDIMGIWSKDD